ncbi:hypothetical protein PENTCL1PPCAC_24004, partial [Pristionchus entomophagus]
MPRARGGNRSRSDESHSVNTPEQDRLLAFVKHLNLSPEHNSTAAANSSNQAGSSRNVSLPDSLPVEDSPPLAANTLNNAHARDFLQFHGWLPAASGAAAAARSVRLAAATPARPAAPSAQRRPRRRRGARGSAAPLPHSQDDWASSPPSFPDPEHHHGATHAAPPVEPSRDGYLGEWHDPTPRDIDEWNWVSDPHEYGIDTDGWGIEPSDPDYDAPPGLGHYIGGPPPGLTPTHGDPPPGLTRGSRRNRRRRRRGGAGHVVVAPTASGAASIDWLADPWFGQALPHGAFIDEDWDIYQHNFEEDDDDEAPDGPQEQLNAIERELRFLSNLATNDSVIMDGLREHINDLESERELARHELWLAAREFEERCEEEEAKAERLRIAHEADNQPEALALRYSRACGICVSANPRVRVALVECGHLLCEPCVERLDQAGPHEVNCPFCRTGSKYIRIFEELEEAADGAAPAAAHEQEKAADPAPEPTGNEAGPQTY